MVAGAQVRDALGHLDPRTRVGLTVLFAVSTALAGSVRGAGIALCAAVFLVLAARLNVRVVGGRLLVVGGFAGVLWATLPFSVPGEVVFEIGPLQASAEGLALAQVMSLRIVAIVLGTLALIGAMPVLQLAQVLTFMRAPHKLVLMVFFCFRYVEVIEEEYLRLRRAMRVRGFYPRTSLHTYRTYAYLLGMLLVRSFDRSERVYQAMRCRGFCGRFPVYQALQWQRRDAVWAGGAVAALFAVVWMG